jgi:hypothetical protein
MNSMEGGLYQPELGKHGEGGLYQPELGKHGEGGLYQPELGKHGEGGLYQPELGKHGEGELYQSTNRRCEQVTCRDSDKYYILLFVYVSVCMYVRHQGCYTYR